MQDVIAKVVELIADIILQTVLQLTGAALSKSPAACIDALKPLVNLNAVLSLTLLLNLPPEATAVPAVVPERKEKGAGAAAVNKTSCAGQPCQRAFHMAGHALAAFAGAVEAVARQGVWVPQDMVSAGEFHSDHTFELMLLRRHVTFTCVMHALVVWLSTQVQLAMSIVSGAAVRAANAMVNFSHHLVDTENRLISGAGARIAATGASLLADLAAGTVTRLQALSVMKQHNSDLILACVLMLASTVEQQHMVKPAVEDACAALLAMHAAGKLDEASAADVDHAVKQARNKLHVLPPALKALQAALQPGKDGSAKLASKAAAPTQPPGKVDKAAMAAKQRAADKTMRKLLAEVRPLAEISAARMPPSFIQ